MLVKETQSMYPDSLPLENIAVPVIFYYLVACCQPIGSCDWKFLLTNMDFNMGISLLPWLNNTISMRLTSSM